jgi:hypothetical protein
MAAIRDVVERIDWDLLRDQKSWLLAMGVELGEGVIGLLDEIQDAAVADGLATEEAVFGAAVCVGSGDEPLV